MSDETSISPLSAAKMADAAYALKDNTLAEAAAITDFSFDNVATAHAADRKGLTGKTGAFGYQPSSGFGFCTKSSNGQDAFIVIKGTSPCMEDALTDLNAIPMSTGHGNVAASGFVKTFNTMEQQIDDFINTGNYKTIHCIGHSLGGALATLVANKYCQQNNANIKLYTFGSPRVFYGPGNKLQNVDSYRVYHEGDPVPMLGPFPLMHYDGGMSVGSLSSICNPLKHAMESYKVECNSKSWQGLRGVTSTPISVIEKGKAFVSASAGWLLRMLKHLVTYGLAALGLGVAGVAGAVYATYTAADILFKLMLQGMSKLSSWVVALLRGMSRFIHNGWESAKAKTSDAYYTSKRVIQYIIDQFLMKMNQLATAAISHTRTAVTAGVDTLRQISPILTTTGTPLLPMLYFL